MAIKAAHRGLSVTKPHIFLIRGITKYAVSQNSLYPG